MALSCFRALPIVWDSGVWSTSDHSPPDQPPRSQLCDQRDRRDRERRVRQPHRARPPAAYPCRGDESDRAGDEDARPTAVAERPAGLSATRASRGARVDQPRHRGHQRNRPWSQQRGERRDGSGDPAPAPRRRRVSGRGRARALSPECSHRCRGEPGGGRDRGGSQDRPLPQGGARDANEPEGPPGRRWSRKSSVSPLSEGRVRSIQMAEPLKPQRLVRVDESNGEAGDPMLVHELRDPLPVPRDHARRRVRRQHGPCRSGRNVRRGYPDNQGRRDGSPDTAAQRHISLPPFAALTIRPLNEYIEDLLELRPSGVVRSFQGSVCVTTTTAVTTIHRSRRFERLCATSVAVRLMRPRTGLLCSCRLSGRPSSSPCLPDGGSSAHGGKAMRTRRERGSPGCCARTRSAGRCR